jgi:hypothetical protein
LTTTRYAIRVDVTWAIPCLVLLRLSHLVTCCCGILSVLPLIVNAALNASGRIIRWSAIKDCQRSRCLRALPVLFVILYRSKVMARTLSRTIAGNRFKDQRRGASPASRVAQEKNTWNQPLDLKVRILSTLRLSLFSPRFCFNYFNHSIQINCPSKTAFAARKSFRLYAAQTVSS